MALNVISARVINEETFLKILRDKGKENEGSPMITTHDFKKVNPFDFKCAPDCPQCKIEKEQKSKDACSPLKSMKTIGEIWISVNLGKHKENDLWLSKEDYEKRVEEFKNILIDNLIINKVLWVNDLINKMLLGEE